jgi:branched-subunit amino acid aminotransferase/4-amino-4-deoxychorismate lyase
MMKFTDENRPHRRRQVNSAWHGSFYRLQDHLERFQRSVSTLRMTSPESSDLIRSIVHEPVALPGFRNAYVQIILTRGRHAGAENGTPAHRVMEETRGRAAGWYAEPFVYKSISG